MDMPAETPVVPDANAGAEDSRVADAISALSAGDVNQLTAKLQALGVPETTAGALAQSLIQSAISSKQNDAAQVSALAEALKTNTTPVAEVVAGEKAFSASVTTPDGATNLSIGQESAASVAADISTPQGPATVAAGGATNTPDQGEVNSVVQKLLAGGASTKIPGADVLDSGPKAPGDRELAASVGRTA